MIPSRFSTLLFSLVLALSARAQTTVAVTGGDAGQGLTLNAANVVAAYNLNGSSSFTVQGVTFTPFALGEQDPVTSVITSEPFAGSETSANDSALNSIFHSVSFNGDLGITFTGLVANARYQFDVLQYAGDFAQREQAILANGVLISLVTVSQTTAQNTTFFVDANGSGEIDLYLTQSQNYGGFGNQDGALLNGVVLSTASAIPEPSTYAVFFGVMVLGLAVWRRHTAAPRK